MEASARSAAAGDTPRSVPARIRQALLFLLLAGLAVVGLGGCFETEHQLTEGFARSWGCRYEPVRRSFDRRSVRRAARGARGQEVKRFDRPDTTWTACDVLGHNGAPDGIERRRGEREQVVWWRYELRRGGERVAVHRVRLASDSAVTEPGRPGWAVDSVAW